MKAMLEDVATERDVAIETLQANNLYQSFLRNLDDGHVTTSGHVTSANQIHQQNAHLKAGIAEMRRKMEQLALRSTNQITAEGAGDQVGVAPSHGYVHYLEKEVVRLKAEGRHLRHTISSWTQGEGEEQGEGEGEGDGEGDREGEGEEEGEGGEKGGEGRRAREGPLDILTSAVAVLQREKVWLKERAKELEVALRRTKEEVRMGRR